MQGAAQAQPRQQPQPQPQPHQQQAPSGAVDDGTSTGADKWHPALTTDHTCCFLTQASHPLFSLPVAPAKPRPSLPSIRTNQPLQTSPHAGGAAAAGTSTQSESQSHSQGRGQRKRRKRVKHRRRSPVRSKASRDRWSPSTRSTVSFFPNTSRGGKGALAGPLDAPESTSPLGVMDTSEIMDLVPRRVLDAYVHSCEPTSPPIPVHSHTCNTRHCNLHKTSYFGAPYVHQAKQKHQHQHQRPGDGLSEHGGGGGGGGDASSGMEEERVPTTKQQDSASPSSIATREAGRPESPWEATLVPGGNLSDVSQLLQGHYRATGYDRIPSPPLESMRGYAASLEAESDGAANTTSAASPPPPPVRFQGAHGPSTIPHHDPYAWHHPLPTAMPIARRGSATGSAASVRSTSRRNAPARRPTQRQAGGRSRRSPRQLGADLPPSRVRVKVHTAVPEPRSASDKLAETEACYRVPASCMLRLPQHVAERV